MRILQTPPRFFPYIGGTEEVSFQQSKELVKRGHEVQVICANEPSVGDSIIEGVSVKRLPYFCKVANTNITLGLKTAISEQNFDIIHTHLPHPWSADVSALISLLKNKPLFLTYHNDITGQGLNRHIANFYNFTALQFLLKRSEKIFISHGNYLNTSPFLAPFSHKVIVNTLGVDTEKYRPISVGFEKDDYEVKKIFFLSVLDKFHEYKGLKYLLEAIKEVKKYFSVKLFVGGKGDLLEKYKAFVRDNGLSDEVKFLGYLSDDEVLKYYNLCDVFILPSIDSTQEGFGLVPLEAMACRKPVIVSDIVGVARDVEKNNAGIVVKPMSSDAIVSAIKKIFSDKNSTYKMGENAFNLVKKEYTWERHVDILEEEYFRGVK